MDPYSDVEEMICEKQLKRVFQELNESEKIHELLAPKFGHYKKEIEMVLRESNTRRICANTEDSQRRRQETHKMRYATIIIKSSNTISDKIRIRDIDTDS